LGWSKRALVYGMQRNMRLGSLRLIIRRNNREFAELGFRILKRKQPRIDVIGTQMQTSYYTFLQNFVKILYNDT